MNKWFWIDGQSNDLAAGKKGAKIDPAKRRFIALNGKNQNTILTSNAIFQISGSYNFIKWNLNLTQSNPQSR